MVFPNKIDDNYKIAEIRAICPSSSKHTTYVVLSIPNMSLTQYMPAIINALSVCESDVFIKSRDYENFYIKFKSDDDMFDAISCTKFLDGDVPFPYTARYLDFYGDGWVISSDRDMEYMSICVRSDNMLSISHIVQNLSMAWG